MLREGDPVHAPAVGDHLSHDVCAIEPEQVATDPQRRKLAGIRTEFGLGAGALRDSLPSFGPQMNGNIGAARHPAAYDAEAGAGTTVRHLPPPARRCQIHQDFIAAIQDDPGLDHAGVAKGDCVGASSQPGETVAAVRCQSLFLRPVFSPAQPHSLPGAPAAPCRAQRLLPPRSAPRSGRSWPSQPAAREST